MDSFALEHRIEEEDSETIRLLKFMLSLPTTAPQVTVKTFLTDDTRNPWRGEYAGMESNSN